MRREIHFVPLVESGGVVYLVCITIDVEDDCEVEEASLESSREFSGLSRGRRRSYADVATFGKRHKRETKLAGGDFKT